MTSTYSITETTTWRELDGEIVVLENDRAFFYAIGGFGTVLWPRLVEGTTQEALIDEITATFDDVSPEQAAADVDEWLAMCIDRGIVEEVVD